MKGLTDIPGIRVGHASDYDAITGCTVILCESGAVAGVDVRGWASGTHELDVLDPLHVTPSIHGLVFSGGSAFGLETATGVMRFLEARGVGFVFGPARVPIVPAAILFDLGIGKSNVRPTREMGEAAAAAARTEAVEEGCVGAGTGAVVGKLLGMNHAMKGGVGSYTVDLGGTNSGVLVSALVAVNALGDVLDKAGNIIAGVRKSPESKQFADGALIMKRGRPGRSTGGNTTLVAVATNARLTKVEARKLAQMGQHGMVRAISPVHTMSDGDVVFALSLGDKRASVNSLGVAAAEAVAEAIIRSVRHARTLGGVPGLA